MKDGKDQAPKVHHSNKAKQRSNRKSSQKKSKNAVDKSSDKRPSQADILMSLASGAFFFHSADGTAFADATVAGHRETWPVKSKGFRRWIITQYLAEVGGAPNSEALMTAINTLESYAQVEGTELPVFVRVGGHEGRIYLDLGDASWRAIEIDDAGWRIVDCPPVRFRRSSGMQPLPTPQKGGSIGQLKAFLNLEDEASFVLVVSWALAVLRDAGPYPILAVTGEQGSAKSTFSQMLRSLLDPNTAALRSLPREERDLYISANGSHVLAFDNVSGVPHWLSDAFCRIATGGAFALRQLYSDQDEVLFDACRPILLNGIDDLLSRPDLADRAILLNLSSIPEDKRRAEGDLWNEFNDLRPAILGALLNAMSEGLRRLPLVVLDGLPRMADFAKWGTACETSYAPEGTFIAAYNENRANAVDNVLDGDSVVDAVRKLMARAGKWEGTASTLLGSLTRLVDDGISRSFAWPSTPKALSNRLRRSATFLRKTGIDIQFLRSGKAGTRLIQLTKKDIDGTDGGMFKPTFPAPSSASAVSVASAVEPPQQLLPTPNKTARIDLNSAKRQRPKHW